MPNSIHVSNAQYICTTRNRSRHFFVPKQTNNISMKKKQKCHIMEFCDKNNVLEKKKDPSQDLSHFSHSRWLNIGEKNMKLPIAMIVLKYFYCIFCNLHWKCRICCTKPSPLIDSLAGKHFWNSTPSSQSWKDVVGSNQTIFMFLFSNYKSTCWKITPGAVHKYLQLITNDSPQNWLPQNSPLEDYSRMGNFGVCPSSRHAKKK